MKTDSTNTAIRPAIRPSRKSRFINGRLVLVDTSNTYQHFGVKLNLAPESDPYKPNRWVE